MTVTPSNQRNKPMEEDSGNGCIQGLALKGPDF